MVFGAHRDEPTAGDVEDEIAFKGKRSQGIFGQTVPWMRRVEEMYGNRSCMRGRGRARQQDLTTKCDWLVMNDESKLLDIFRLASRVARDVHTKGLVVFSQVTRSISTVGAARNLRSCSCNS